MINFKYTSTLISVALLLTSPASKACPIAESYSIFPIDNPTPLTSWDEYRNIAIQLRRRYEQILVSIPRPSPKEIEWLKNEYDSKALIRVEKARQSDIDLRIHVIKQLERTIATLNALQREPDGVRNWLYLNNEIIWMTKSMDLVKLKNMGYISHETLLKDYIADNYIHNCGELTRKINLIAFQTIAKKPENNP